MTVCKTKLLGELKLKLTIQTVHRLNCVTQGCTGGPDNCKAFIIKIAEAKRALEEALELYNGNFA